VKKTKKVVLGGGCFWGMQELFRSQPGVLNTRVGYCGGSVKNPTYENHDGHAEVVEIEYDPDRTSYANILDFFFQIHDPTTVNRQGNDVGSSYRSAIFYNDEDEKVEAKNFINIVNESARWSKPVATTLERFEQFYEAEDYHQDYLQKYPDDYTCHFVRFGSYLSQ
jgi:peptide-methionine (S)-S-oxide reductase